LNNKKIIPIVRVEKKNKQLYKFIEWKLHNVCNYNCVYCCSGNKDGSRRWVSLEQYKQQVHALVKAADGSPIWIQMTGGEPTLFPELMELLEYIKSFKIYVSIATNGSRTIRWWKEVSEKNLIDNLIITFHSDTVKDSSHIIEVLNLFQDRPTRTICLITHTFESFAWAFKAQQELLENTGAVLIIKPMRTLTNEMVDDYTDDQTNQMKLKNMLFGKFFNLKKQMNVPTELSIDQKLTVTYDDNSTENLDTFILVKNRDNKFQNWLCDTGRNFMHIDGENIFRGSCREGGTRKITDDNLSFTDDFITCTLDHCFCSSDLISTKINPTINPKFYSSSTK
jgi:organic radical activating enzyme